MFAMSFYVYTRQCVRVKTVSTLQTVSKLFQRSGLTTSSHQPRG